MSNDDRRHGQTPGNAMAWLHRNELDMDLGRLGQDAQVAGI
jgi:hypothetical protein